MNASNFPNNYTTYSLDQASTVEFNRAGDQDVPYHGIQYGKLILSGSGIKSPRSTTATDTIFTVNDELTINSGVTLALYNNTSVTTPFHAVFNGVVNINPTATLDAWTSGRGVKVSFLGPIVNVNGSYRADATGSGYTPSDETCFGNTTINGNDLTQLYNTRIIGYTTSNVNLTITNYSGNDIFTIESGGTLNPEPTKTITFNTIPMNVVGTARVTRANSNLVGQYIGTGTRTYSTGTIEFAGTSETVDNFAWGNLLMSGTVALNTSMTTAPVGNLSVTGTFNLSTYTINGNSSGKILTLGPTGVLQIGGTTGGVTGSNFPTGYTGIPSINSTSRVLYNGTSAQAIANTIMYGILEVNNTAGVNLNNGTITANSLTMTSGNMTTGANVMRVTNYRDGNGLIIGTIRQIHPFVAGTYYYFEGPNTYVRPTGMTTTPDSITITSYPNTNIPVGNPAYAIKRYYDITQHGGSGLTSTLRLHYDTAEKNGLNESAFTLWRYNGTAWDDQLFSSRVIGSANSYVEQTGIAQFSYWTIAEGAGPLPVQLTSFTTSAKKFDVTLEWKTASEKNNYGFDIERQSTDGVWTKIGFVGGHGTTTVPQEYSYTDKNAPSGTLNYRLKQTDFDGTFEYSKIVEVLSGATDKSFMLGQNYPSPFNPATTIEFSIPDDAPTSLKVYNTLGQEVASLVDGEILPAGLIHKVTFNGTNLSSGTYYYILKSGKFSAVKKMILLK